LTAIVCNFIGADVEQVPERDVAAGAGPRLVHTAAATDGDLVGAICNGDQSAFSALVKRHYDAVYRVAWRVLGGPSDAEDVTQEAFLKLWQSPDALRDGRAVRAWLMRVASNQAIDRARRKQPQLMDELPDVSDDGPSPEAAMSQQQAAGSIDEAIQSLPDRQRLALVLTYYEHMGNQQTAEVMDLSVDAVESLLSRARRNLKSALAGQWRDMLDEIAGE
jgi:RNA polymerase sigma-70 factor (ECF subfamily)